MKDAQRRDDHQDVRHDQVRHLKPEWREEGERHNTDADRYEECHRVTIRAPAAARASIGCMPRSRTAK